MAAEHSEHQENVGAYLLGALDELERHSFERHLMGCSACRDEVERLRPAADALPRSVTPVAAPPRLKQSLMAVVERGARERRGEEESASGASLARFAPALARMRPAAAWLSAAFLLAIGVVSGYAVTRVVAGDEGRTVIAAVDQRRVPSGSGRLVLGGDREGAILRVNGMPKLAGDSVYQVWLRRDGEVVSESIFNVGADGSGAAAVPDDLGDADSVLVTRERRGGAPAPTEDPIVRVEL